MNARENDKAKTPQKANVIIVALIIATAVTVISALGLRVYQQHQALVYQQQALVQKQKSIMLAQGAELIGHLRANLTRYRACNLKDGEEARTRNCDAFIASLDQEVQQIPSFFTVDATVSLYWQDFLERDTVDMLGVYDQYNLQSLIDTLSDQLLALRQKLYPDLYTQTGDA